MEVHSNQHSINLRRVAFSMGGLLLMLPNHHSGGSGLTRSVATMTPAMPLTMLCFCCWFIDCDNGAIEPLQTTTSKIALGPTTSEKSLFALSQNGYGNLELVCLLCLLMSSRVDTRSIVARRAEVQPSRYSIHCVGGERRSRAQ